MKAGTIVKEDGGRFIVRLDDGSEAVMWAGAVRAQDQGGLRVGRRIQVVATNGRGDITEANAGGIDTEVANAASKSVPVPRGRHKGTIARVFWGKNFGFIKPEDDGEDVHFWTREFERLPGSPEPEEGASLTYEVRSTDRGGTAWKLGDYQAPQRSDWW